MILNPAEIESRIVKLEQKPQRPGGGAGSCGGFSNWCVVDPASPGPGQRGSFCKKFKTLAAALAAAQDGDVIGIVAGTHVGNFDLSAFRNLRIMALGSEQSAKIENAPASAAAAIIVAPVGGVPRRISVDVLVRSTNALPAVLADATAGPIESISVSDVAASGPGNLAMIARFLKHAEIGSIEQGVLLSENSDVTVQYSAQDVSFKVDPTIGPVNGRSLNFGAAASMGNVALVGAPQVSGGPGANVQSFDGTAIVTYSAPDPAMSLEIRFHGTIGGGAPTNLAVPPVGYTHPAAAAAPVVIDLDNATIAAVIRMAPTVPAGAFQRVSPTARNADFTNGANIGSISVGDKVDLDMRGSYYQQVQLAVDGFPALGPDHGSINRDWYSPTNWLEITIPSGAPQTYLFIPYPTANEYGVLVTPKTIVPGDVWAINNRTVSSVDITHSNPAADPQTFDLEFTGRRQLP